MHLLYSPFAARSLLIMLLSCLHALLHRLWTMGCGDVTMGRQSQGNDPGNCSSHIPSSTWHYQRTGAKIKAEGEKEPALRSPPTCFLSDAMKCGQSHNSAKWSCQGRRVCFVILCSCVLFQLHRYLQRKCCQPSPQCHRSSCALSEVATNLYFRFCWLGRGIQISEPLVALCLRIAIVFVWATCGDWML